jgi:hypothetical protein
MDFKKIKNSTFEIHSIQPSNEDWVKLWKY